MKAKTASPETAVLTAERKLHNTWVYIKRHWQLYLLFLLPAVRQRSILQAILIQALSGP